MKKLTKEEAQQIVTRPRGRLSVARMYLMNMEVGDIILLEPKDWKQKTRNPSTYCRILGRRTNREWSCAQAVDHSGWVIERVK